MQLSSISHNQTKETKLPIAPQASFVRATAEAPDWKQNIAWQYGSHVVRIRMLVAILVEQ